MNSPYYIRIWNANKRTFPHQAPAGLGISIRDEIFAKSRDPGIFRDGISLLISSQDFSGPDWLNISILRFVGKFFGFYGHFEIIVLSDIFKPQKSQDIPGSHRGLSLIWKVRKVQRKI